MSESFTFTAGKLVSSEGFSVQVRGRNVIIYADNTVNLRIDAEMMGQGLGSIIWTESFAQRTSDMDGVIDNIRRALGSLGATLQVE